MGLFIRFITIVAGGVVSFTSPMFDGSWGIIIASFFIILGLISLIWGGDMLVTGSSSVANKFGIPPIVIGLTVLAFGTSAPELFVNLIASSRGETDLLISNVIGSNLSNILLIGGTAAMIARLPVQQSTFWKEIPLSLLATGVLFILINDKLFDGSAINILSTEDGVILLVIFCWFLWHVFQLIREHKSILNPEDIAGGPPIPIHKAILFIVLGIYGLYVGGDLMVAYTSTLAEMFGVSKVMIGASIVAIGTSVPELVTSVIAARKQQTDMAVGNIIGSNIFNIVWIVGLCIIIRPLPIHTSLNIDIILLLIVTILLRILLYLRKDRTLHRKHGIMMMLLYACYLGFLLRRG